MLAQVDEVAASETLQEALADAGGSQAELAAASVTVAAVTVLGGSEDNRPDGPTGLGFETFMESMAFSLAVTTLALLMDH